MGKDDCLNIWTNNLEKQLYSFNLSIYGRATTLETTILDQKDIILVGVKDKTCDILVWDLVEQKKTMSLKGHTEEITSIRITKLFGKVVSGSLDKTIRVWSLKTQAQLLCINTDHETFCLEITKNELTIVSTQKDCRIRLFELETGKQTGITNKYPHQTTPMALTPDSTMVILGGRSSSSSLKKVFLNKIKSKLILPTQKPVKLLTLSPNSEYLAASDSIIIYLWQLSTPTDPPEILQGHLKPIKGVIFTKDSQSKSILISGDEDFNIKVWDLPSGSLKFAIKEPLEGLSGLFIRENSDKILVVSHDKILRVLNIEKRTFDQVFQFTTCIIKLVVSHNGNRLYAGDSLGTIFELDIEGTFKKLRQTLKDLGKIEALAITHDDQKLYSSCSGSNFIKLWGLDSKELKLLATITGHSARVHSLIINKESNRLFSGSADKKICLWDIAQNKRIAELEGHGNLINGLALSIDEKTLFSGSEDRTVRGWNIEDCRQMSFICGHTTKVLKLAVNESGNLLASGDESGTVILWDLSKNQRKCSIDPLNDSPIQGLAFSYLINKDQLIISYQTDKGALFTLQQESLTQTSLFEYRTKVPATTIVITKDQMKVVLGFTDGTIRIWGLEALDNIERVIEGDKGSILALIVDKEGKRIIGGGKKGYIIIWEFINGKEMTRLKGHKVLRVLELENNEMRLFSGGDEGEVIIWDYKKLAILNRIDGMKWKGMITCMKASVDGKKLFVTCNNDNTIENIINNYNNNPSEVDEQEQSFLHIFSLETYHSIPNATLVYPSTDIVLSSNSNLLIYCFGTSIQVLQYPSLLPITLFSGQLSSLTAETLSPNHEFLVLADKENRITVWNMKTQMGLIEFRGHTNSISFLIVTSKNMIISASSDNTIRIWSIEERRLIDKLESHNAYINAMVISKNEELLLSTSAGTGIILWDLKTRKQLKHFLTSETFIYGLYISSDQTYFLSVGDKAVLNLWDLNDEYKKPRVLAIFEGSIIKMKISPDQKILLVFIAYPTEKIQFWETDSYTLVNEIEYDVQSSMPVFLTGKYNRLIFLGDKLIDCFTGRVIFTFTPKEKIMSFFYDYTNSSYFFISIEFKLYQINEDWLATYLYNYLNSDGVQNLRKEVSHICDRDYSIFPYFFSFLHLISIYDQNQDFTLERMKSVMRKGEADLFGVFYSLDIFLNTPLDILIQRKNPSLVIKYFDMLFKCIKEVDFYQKVRFFHYAFRDNYTILDLLCDLLKLIGSNISSIGKLLDEAFLPLPLSIYDNLLIYKEFNEPLLIETDSLYMNREFIEEKLKENDKNRDKTGEENHCLVKAKILCVPGIFDLNLERTREFYGLISNIEMDNDILMNKTFEMLVNFIWDRKVFYFYRIDFFVFLFFFLIFNINFAFLSQFRFEANSPNIFKFTSFILDLLLFFYSIFTLINESRQLLYNKWNYFKSFWNFIDIALIPLLMTSSLLDISLLINEYIEGIAYYQLLFSLCIGSLWFRLLSFSRGVKEMSSMIRLIFNVISGVRYFVLFMVLFMLALSSSLFLIRSHTSYENSFWETFLIFYDSAVGDTSGISSYEVVFSNFEEYYMILASFLFAIISVNLLVSIIGDKHNENKENEVKTRTYELLNIIVDNETSLVSQIVKRIKGPQHNSRFLLCLYNEKHERVEVVGIENEIEKLGKELQEHKDWIEGEIEKGVQRIEKEVRKGHEDNQNFIRI